VTCGERVGTRTPEADLGRRVAHAKELDCNLVDAWISLS
jgi:hypothetical protein